MLLLSDEDRNWVGTYYTYIFHVQREKPAEASFFLVRRRPERIGVGIGLPHLILIMYLIRPLIIIMYAINSVYFR